ncbi:TolB-like 6-blade propeller-like [Algoriphagus locisalis]|uniref:TolB-like 6-blade propeller-like n=1 Tax=Algoriphagus locisalis TaxID=305507 RepID=A0A1I7C8Q3_9BACT|nr:BF3164 family lipoprotein [Algoriphagus locisalis]SFT95821.1 TolB-like 6-blade propeller-like [Algoriphagus locisalis]
MKNNVLSFFLTLTFLTSCENHAEKKIKITENELEINDYKIIESHSFKKYFDYIGGTPYNFIATDSGLFIHDIDGKNNKIVHFLNFQKQELTQGFIGKGNGLYESFSPKSSSLKNGYFMIFDFTMRKVIEKNLITEDFNEIKLPNYFDKIKILNEEHLIGSGSKESIKKFQVLNRSNGELIDEIGDYIKFPENLNPEEIRKYFQFSMDINPNEFLVASAYRWHDCIEIFNIKTRESFSIVGPSKIDNYEALVVNQSGEHIFERTPDVQHCFLGISVSKKYIYGLFSGKKDKEENAFFGKEVFIYDWNGKPDRKIILDREVMTISISPDDKKLYAFDVDTSEVLYIDL